MIDFLQDGARRAAHTLILAHGAGTAMDHPGLARLAEGIAQHGIRVLRFEFPYMAGRRTGTRRGPDRAPVLLATWREAIDAADVAPERLFIGGRSMGGRIASMVADEAGVAGLLCYGYPFHPPGQPEKLRTAHLERLHTPAVIFQGERDPFGTREDVAGYRLARAIRVRWMPDGDHGLKPRKASGFNEADYLAAVIEESVAFIATGERPRSPRARATSSAAGA